MMLDKGRDLVITGVVAPVCKDFEGVFEGSVQDVIYNPVLRFLSADRRMRRLYLHRVVLDEATLFVTIGRPRLGRISGGLFDGFAVRQVTQTDFMLARPFIDAVRSTKLPLYEFEDFWDKEYINRKREVPFGETLLMDLGER